jgi:FMN phosphatase YigB (HAD superfamily)
VRVVCFDLGGVLVRIHGGWRAACRDTGIGYDPVLDSDAFRARVRPILDAQQRGACTLADASAALASATGGRYTSEQIATLHGSWLQGLYDGVESLLTSLHAVDGLVTACLSNTDPSHWERLSNWSPGAPYRTLGALRHQFASCVLGLAKPDRAIYEAVTCALDARPEQVLFFDDTLHNVEAARAHGWRADRIDPTRETVPQLRDRLAAHGILDAPDPV